MDMSSRPLTTESHSLVAAQVPLVVDLDGTLLRTDALLESLFAVARAHPQALPGVPLWLLRGRAHLKRKLAERAHLDAATLPLDSDLLDHLRGQRRHGRRIILASGADATVAEAVAAQCGVFDSVIASDGVVNLTATRKRDRLVADLGDRGFDYVGNSAQDLPIWAAARCALLVEPSTGLIAAVGAVTPIHRIFARKQPQFGTYTSAMRVQHWLKNLLLLVPILFAHSLYNPALLASALIGALCFCLAASGVYLLNDLLDLGSDRLHPHKKHRALASGQLPIQHALVLLPGLWLGATLLAIYLPGPFLGALCLYVVLMLAYSIRLKDIAIIDALVLAMGYSLRIQAGALAVGIMVSPWLLVCSSAMFFGLALLKRYAELVVLRPASGADREVRAYSTADSAIVAALGGASGCVAVSLLALYPVIEPTRHDRWPLWLVCGFILFWVGHMWLMAHRGAIRDDPVAFAVRDPVSRLFGLLTVITLLVTT
jgi:4-hydroxybenzoate polyprenyltransferase/phosphoserine phosphatase